MDNLRSRWENLNPQTKRTGTMMLVVIGLFIILAVYVTGTDNGPRKRATSQKVIKTPLTGTSDAVLGVEALAAKLNSMKTEYESDKAERERENTRLMEELKSLKDDSKKTEEYLNARLEAAEVEAKTAKSSAAALEERQREYDAANGSSGGSPGVSLNPMKPTAVIEAEWNIFERDAADGIPIPADGGKPGTTDPAMPKTPAKIVPVGAIENQDDADKVKAEADKAKAPPIVIPSGSILSGTLLTGLDAPTAASSKNEPFPALLRIKTDAILPNFNRMDIQECFLLAGGFGELSSERVLMRAERLSCVTQSGGVIETGIDAFASGEDGKVGVRGRLVTRMGAALANSLLAGFAAGAAQVFTPMRVPVLSNDPSSGYFENRDPSQAAQSGLGSGASSSLTRLADFYMNLAEQTFPTIEIDSGRSINFVLVRGVTLPEPPNAAYSTQTAAARTP